MKSPEHCARRFDWKLVPESAINRCDGLDQCPSLAGAIDVQPSAFGLQHCRSDALVYVLYALTPAEIKIAEGAAK